GENTFAGSSHIEKIGVYIFNNSHVTTSAGNIAVNGIAHNVDSGYRVGISIEDGAQITSTTGDISLVGRAGSDGDSYGILVYDFTSGTLRSVSGNLTLTGSTFTGAGYGIGVTGPSSVIGGGAMAGTITFVADNLFDYTEISTA